MIATVAKTKNAAFKEIVALQDRNVYAKTAIAPLVLFLTVAARTRNAVKTVTAVLLANNALVKIVPVRNHAKLVSRDVVWKVNNPAKSKINLRNNVAAINKNVATPATAVLQEKIASARTANALKSARKAIRILVGAAKIAIVTIAKTVAIKRGLRYHAVANPKQLALAIPANVAKKLPIWKAKCSSSLLWYSIYKRDWKN